MDKMYDSALSSTGGLARAMSWIMSLAAVFQIGFICAAAYSIYWLVRKPRAVDASTDDDRKPEPFWSTGRIVTLVILCIYALAQLLGLFGSTAILAHTIGGGGASAAGTPSIFKTPSTDITIKA